MSKSTEQCYRCGNTPCDCHDELATPEKLCQECEEKYGIRHYTAAVQKLREGK